MPLDFGNGEWMRGEFIMSFMQVINILAPIETKGSSLSVYLDFMVHLLSHIPPVKDNYFLINHT